MSVKNWQQKNGKQRAQILEQIRQMGFFLFFINFTERFSLCGLSLEVCMLLSSPAPSHLFYIFFLLLFNIVVSVVGNFFLAFF